MGPEGECILYPEGNEGASQEQPEAVLYKGNYSTCSPLEKWVRDWSLFKMSQEGGWIAGRAEVGEGTQDPDLVRSL